MIAKVYWKSTGRELFLEGDEVEIIPTVDKQGSFMVLVTKNAVEKRAFIDPADPEKDASVFVMNDRGDTVERVRHVRKA